MASSKSPFIKHQCTCPHAGSAVIEINGDDRDDEEAERQAVEKAELLPDDVWVMQPFDEGAYRPHVQSMISREELAELTKEGRSANAALADLGEAVHYQILKGNCDTGEGELALQPWAMSPICSPPTSAAGGSVRWRTSG